MFGQTRDVRQFLKTNRIFQYIIIASSVGKVVKAAVGGSLDSLLDGNRKLMRILDDSRNFIHLSHFRVEVLSYLGDEGFGIHMLDVASIDAR